VLGSGTRALTLALWSAVGGAEPVLLADGRLGTDTSGLARRALIDRLHSRGIVQLTGRPVALSADGVQWRDPTGGQHTVVADGLVVCEPLQPNHFDAERAVEVIRIGDARRIGDIPAAIADGRDTVDAFSRRASLLR
jgi:hypothetical protein